MATYLEILALSKDADLIQRTKVAVVVASDTVRAESDQTANHAARLSWAGRVLSIPDTEAERALLCVLAQNRALTVNQITGADDAALQTAVNAAVDLLAVR